MSVRTRRAKKYNARTLMVTSKLVTGVKLRYHTKYHSTGSTPVLCFPMALKALGDKSDANIISVSERRRSKIKHTDSV